MRKILIVVFIVCFCLSWPLFVSGENLPAQDKQVKTGNLKIDAGKLTLKLRTDLRVDMIHSSHCKCDLDDVDAFYMSNIMVDVSNHKVAGVGTGTPSFLTVTYHDINLGKMVTVKKELAKLNSYPANPWTFQRYIVVHRPVLVKKSIGITASIRAKSTGISDSDPSNNKKTVYKCNVMIY